MSTILITAGIYHCMNGSKIIIGWLMVFNWINIKYTIRIGI